MRARLIAPVAHVDLDGFDPFFSQYFGFPECGSIHELPPQYYPDPDKPR
jgi:hypothetical protein